MKKHIKWYLCFIFAVSLNVFAQGGSFPDFLKALAIRESSLIPSKVNEFGFVGLFQFGEAALEDAGYYRRDATPRTNDFNGQFTGRNGVNSLADFKANPDAQVKAVVDFQAAQRRQIANLGLDAAIGRTINGVLITESGLLAGAHLVGVGSLQRFINSNGAIVPVDGNNTSIAEYISRFGGYNISRVAPSYAEVLSGTPTGGLGASPATPTTSSSPQVSRPNAVSPGSAFTGGTGGVTQAKVREAVTLIIATLLLVWLAWTAQSQLQTWRRGGISMISMKSDIIRATVLLSILIVILN